MGIKLFQCLVLPPLAQLAILDVVVDFSWWETDKPIVALIPRVTTFLGTLGGFHVKVSFKVEQKKKKKNENQLWHVNEMT